MNLNLAVLTVLAWLRLCLRSFNRSAAPHGALAWQWHLGVKAGYGYSLVVHRVAPASYSLSLVRSNGTRSELSIAHSLGEAMRVAQQLRCDYAAVARLDIEREARTHRKFAA